MNETKMTEFVEKAVNDVGALLGGAVYAMDTIAERFRTGGGFPWGDQDKLRDIVIGAGFTTFHRAAETPFNIVLEARAS